MTYTPSDEDWQLANQLVAARSRNQTRKESAELEGAMGEIVFSRVFDLHPPEPLSIHSDGGRDFTLPNGITVDVKAISGPDPWRLGLLVPRRIRAGIYTLVHVEFEQGEPCTLLGWCTGGYAATRGEDRGDHYRVTQRDLRNMGELKNASELG